MIPAELVVREWVIEVSNAPKIGNLTPAGKVTIRHQLKSGTWLVWVPGTRYFHPDSGVPPMGGMAEYVWTGDPVGHMPDWLAEVAADTMQDHSRVLGVLAEVAIERAAQDAKWGEQNHPDGTGAHWELMHGQYDGAAEENREDAIGRCMRWFANGGGAWSLILEEEVAEALAEDDPNLLRAELIQVAAVAVQWVQAIDRRSAS